MSVTLHASDIGRVHVVPPAEPFELPIVCTSSGEGGISLIVDDIEKARALGEALIRAASTQEQRAKVFASRERVPGGMASW